MPRLIRYACRDMGVDGIGHLVMGGKPVTGGKFNAGLLFSVAHRGFCSGFFLISALHFVLT